MATPYQSIDPALLALQTAKKAMPASPSTQAVAKPSLNVPKQQPQAISTNITPPVVKIGGISSPFWAPNINSSPVLWWATPIEIKETATQLQSLPKAIPQTWTSEDIRSRLSTMWGDIVLRWKGLAEIKTAYPEFAHIDDETFKKIGGDIALRGKGIDDILRDYPELQWWQKDNFITNLWSGIAWTAAATGQLWKNLAFKAVDLYRTKVQGKEKLTPEQRAMAEQSDMGQNLSSITNRQTEAQKKSIWGQIWTAVWTLWQAFSTPTGVQSLFKIPAVVKIAKKAPIISSMIKWWLQWVIGQDQYTLMTEWRQSTAEEISIAWWIWLAFPFLWAIIKATKPFVQKGIKSAVNTLQTSWIINPAKFDQIKSQLIAEWVEWMEKATVDDVANFLTERWIKGTRQQQADILEEVANKSRLAKKEVLDLSTNLHAPDSAKVLAQTLVDELWTAKSQATKAIANKAQQLLNKLDNWWATLNEIDDLRAMWRKELNTRTSAGNVKISQQDVDNLIWEVRGYIEDAAQKEWLPQLVGYQGEKNLIKMLNNQTSTAKWLAEWILRRDSTDAVQQLMTFMSARGWWVIAWGLAWSQWWMFDNNTTAGKIWNIAVWAFLWWIVDNPKIKSNVAQYLNKLTWTQKGAILKRMESWWKELLEREDKDVINGLKNIIMNNNKEIPNSLPYKPNANITTNDITTSAMGNSNKAGVILSEWWIVPPKPTPKTPPITVEKWAIGMWTPKVNNTPVIPPKATVAPSVSTPKVDTFKRMTELDSNPLYRKLWGGEILWWGKIKQWLFETPLWTITNEIMDGKVKKYIVNWKTYNASDLWGIREKQAPEVVAQANKVSKAISDLKAIESWKGNIMWSSLRSVLDDLWIKDVNSIPEWTEADILQMVRARKPVAPKKWMPKLWKEIMEQDITQWDNLINEAKKYKSAEELWLKVKEGGHILDSLKSKENTFAKIDSAELGKTIKLDIRDLEKQKTGKLQSDYWLKKIKSWKRPPILVGIEDWKLKVIDGNHRASAYLQEKIRDVPIILTEEAKVNLKQIREQANKKTLPPLPNKWK